MIKRDTDYKPHSMIELKSPLAFGGFFLHYLRIRFREEWGAPYIWKESDTDTELFITSGNAINNELRNNRPAVYVNVGPSNTMTTVINDRGAEAWGVTHKFNYNRIGMGFTIRCESDARGEAHNLGWYVFQAMLSAKDVLRQKYHISNFGEIELSPPQPTKEDRETFVSSINFSIIYEYTWNVAPVQTFMRELSLTLDIESPNDPTKFLTEIYLQSLGDTTHREYPQINRDNSNVE